MPIYQPSSPVTGGITPICDGVRFSPTSTNPYIDRYTAYYGSSTSLYVHSMGAGYLTVLYNSALTTILVNPTPTAISLTGLTAGRVYDVFAYSSNGTSLSYELAYWGSSISRTSYSLSRSNGLIVKSTDTTRRFIGCVYLSGTGTVSWDFSYAFNPKCPFYNAYNQVRLTLKTSPGGNYDYTTATARVNQNGAYISYVHPFYLNASDLVIQPLEFRASLRVMSWNNTANVQRAAGLTSGTSASVSASSWSWSPLLNGAQDPFLHAVDINWTIGGTGTFTSGGFNQITPLEWSEAVGTTSWAWFASSGTNATMKSTNWATTPGVSAYPPGSNETSMGLSLTLSY